jgi:hypothetical protein
MTDDTLSPPVVEAVGGFLVVRDDLVPGGTKARVLHRLLVPGVEEYVYASPVQGYAQLALALVARERGVRATVFCAARRERHRVTRAVVEAGARLVEVSPGYLSVVASRARGHCRQTGALLLPFGLACEAMVEALAVVARSVPATPREVWSVAGSGTLSLALQRAWPDAAFHAVVVGRRLATVGQARLWLAPERYEQDARDPPPYPSCGNYDAKLWQFVRRHASPGALVWNVAG